MTQKCINYYDTLVYILHSLILIISFSCHVCLLWSEARFTIYAWASVATGSAYKMIWMRVATCAYAGIEIISIPAYATRVQIILYALPVATRRRQIRYTRPSVYCEPGLSLIKRHT